MDHNKLKESVLEIAKANKKEILVVSAVIILGIFLRAYNFTHWLHFEIDQTYDTRIVSNAVQNGIENLPLLGPTAGGGRALRLGPAFYYMEYISAKIFGDTPQGHAYNVLLVSVLTLPLFYIFVRRFFSKFTSLNLLLLFSISFYVVSYSRFSWSPNVLPFFVILSFYALLKSVSLSEKKKELWFLIATASVAVITQIHFIAFFIMPAATGLFFIIKRPRFRIRIWLVAGAIFLFLYSPLILNEIKTRGQDSLFFTEKVSSGKGTKDKIIASRLSKDVQYNIYEYFLVISGKDQINNATLNQMNSYSLGFVCKSCREGIIWKLLAVVSFGWAAFLLVNNIRREKDDDKKNFYILLSIWFLMSFFLFFMLLESFRIRPRFFLLMSPLAFIFLGLIYEKIVANKKVVGFYIVVAITLFLAALNISSIFGYFNQLQKNMSESQVFQVEDIFPYSARITLDEQYAVVRYIELKYQENKYPVYLRSLPELEAVFWYHLEKDGILYYDNVFRSEYFYREGNYFLISAAKGKNSSLGPVFEPPRSTEIEEKKDFGSLVVYKLQPKEEFMKETRQDESKKALLIEEQQVSSLITWKKLFNKSN
jgi:4-amino-4-deoxy-L-arabinose transferase-like glycosyltransferase